VTRWIIGRKPRNPQQSTVHTGHVDQGILEEAEHLFVQQCLTEERRERWRVKSALRRRRGRKGCRPE
jgi:hypothetical protein